MANAQQANASGKTAIQLLLRVVRAPVANCPSALTEGVQPNMLSPL